MVKEDRCKTGILGLDILLHGGIPQDTCILLAGGPGSGKTILSSQFLYLGASEFGEAGVYVTFDEKISSIKKNMIKFGWDLESLEKEDMLRTLDLSTILYLTADEFHKTAYGVDIPVFSILSTLDVIKENVKEIDAKRIIIDGCTSLSIFEIEESKKRRNLAHLFNGLRELGCTSIVTSESGVTEGFLGYQVEEYLSDGVILLRLKTINDNLIRSIMIEKMRGISHETQPRLYSITDEGFIVYPDEKGL